MKTGYCACGCGEKTNIAIQTRKCLGHVKGEPIRYISGHNLIWENTHRPKSVRYIQSEGYVMLLTSGHPRANISGHVCEHVIVAEKILGDYLPEGAVVHHVNGIKDDNRPENLVICQNSAYHTTLHRRQRALESCGHANWRKCRFCKEYDDPKNLYIYPNRSMGHHRHCINGYERNRRKMGRVLNPSPSKNLIEVS